MPIKALKVILSFLIAMICALAVAIVTRELGQPLEAGLKTAGIAFVGVSTLAIATLEYLSFDSREVRESRERVRDAERGLEAALSEGAGRPHEDRPETPSEERHEGHRLAFALLWEATYSKLELYHKIATRQASMSFWSAQLAMILGFGLLGLFVGVAYNASTTAGAVVAGGLGAVSAALAGFIGRTFVRSQETAAGHLKAYFDQPLEFSRFLAAERLVADSAMTQEQRAEITAELARAIVARPGGTPAAGDTGTSSGGNGAATS
ncbi:hypothetical protein ABZX77_26145 [Streptomyces sp. NPDC004237]|uniref:TRADD-N-associated membrane domain-containing protein n=1 Tax=Streptomyces sp. NPDC004237 TaxID=3154455 RepID=UPI0033B4D87D